MSKTYKHQIKFKSRQYWDRWHHTYRLLWANGLSRSYHKMEEKRELWEPPFWMGQTFEDRGRIWYRKQSWRKFRHQWKYYLKDGGREPHNRPENFDWNLW